MPGPYSTASLSGCCGLCIPSTVGAGCWPGGQRSQTDE